MAPRRNNLSNHHTTVTPTPTAATTVDVHNLLSLTVVGNSVSGDQQPQYQDDNSPLIENNNNKSNISSPSSLISSGSTSPTSSTSSSSSSSSSSPSSLMMSPTRETTTITTATTTTTYIRCCVPTGDCFKMNSSSPDYGLISLENLSDCVRVICNNENCSMGQYMHRECFESWEQTVLITLKTIGRARSWSDRQRSQNLWTKKGYDLVYKTCGCKCGRGHIRKDLDWTPPPVKPAHNGTGIYLNSRGVEEESTKKKKKRNRNNQKPTLALTAINPGTYHPNSQQQATQQINHHHSSTNVGVGIIGNPIVNGAGGNGSNGNSTNANNIGSATTVTTTTAIAGANNNVSGTIDLRTRAGSLSSSSGTTSPPVSASSELSISPVHHSNNTNINANIVNNNNSQIVAMTANNLISNNNHNAAGSINLSMKSLNSIANNNSGGINANGNMLITSANLAPGSKLKQLTPMEQQLVQQQKNKEVEIYSERVRSTSGCNGIFSRRLDFSSFNLLPKTRLNSYQVKIEDEGNHGNDETRLFILSSLAQSQMSRVACILCEEPMLVFDRYPLVDGSFFLSPKQHSPGCIEVKYEGRALYLTCVCMSCLDGTSSGRVISCRFCGEIWDGSSLVLGTMYAYDIFAAMPCCAERLKCNTCLKLLLHPQQRLNFFSDYSHCVTCPYCATQDTHFVKPLGYCYTKNVAKMPMLLA